LILARLQAVKLKDMEIVIGPVLALLLGMKFTDYKSKALEERVKRLEETVALVTTSATTMETEMPKKMLATIIPIAQAVKKLNEQVGL
tara:strand:+ start:138 stop:401 length:264 start_codon:yes stop_codon:yes gene_type:complete